MIMKMLIFCLFAHCYLYGQPPNCNVFLWNKDTLQYKACKLVEDVELTTYQFDTSFIYPMQRAIKICPYFAYAYREISSSYIKTGNFVEWKKYIDKAVEYDPSSYLNDRASLRYKFFADYEGTLNDIKELEKLIKRDLGQTSNGTYHLSIVKGLCHKALGNRGKAIEIIEKQVLQGDNSFNAYDYLHLGVLYLEEGKIEDALKYFEMQANNQELAENQFYIALCYKEFQEYETVLVHLRKAMKLFENQKRMYDRYNELFDQIYLSDIEEEIKLHKKYTRKE